MKPLIFIPTYNERDNIRALFEQIQALGLDFDYLLLDDNSPDGTGDVMDEIARRNPSVKVLHRSGKLGIGSAHKAGIRYAYKNGYDCFVSLDADFTHPPSYIPRLFEATADVVLGSRHMEKNSLDGWNVFRKSLTKLGYFLTTQVLGLKYDATGAFRLYRLNRIPETFLDRVTSNGYAFFFESLYVLHRNGASIAEIPIALPPRTYGSSKMSYREILRSVKLLGKLAVRGTFRPQSVEWNRT